MGRQTTDGVTAHFDRYLGAPRTVSKSRHAEVREYANQPEEGAVTWVTSGLGEKTAKRIPLQRELSFCCYDRFACSEVAGLLAEVARRIVEAGTPHFWGDLIDLGGRVLPVTKAEALYVAQPVFWPHGFETIPPEKPRIWVAWLVPVYRGEARHIERFGFHDFDIRIEEEDADLMDLGRKSIVQGP